MITRDSDVVIARGDMTRAVSVIVPLYNYREYIQETLDSVLAQTTDDLCLIVVNDASKDDSLAVARAWIARAELGSKAAILLDHHSNAGLSVTRNTGIAFAQSPYCFFLDSDNLLYPRCIEKHVWALSRATNAVAAYSNIEVFDGESGLMGTNVFSRNRLKFGNYIDAMAMIQRDYLLSVGGYKPIKHGWEDYDLWLRMCEDNRCAIHLPELLSRYRVHRSSMLRTQTNVRENLRELYATMYSYHPWLELSSIA